LQPQHDGSAPRGTPPKFGPKVTHPPVDLSVGDIRSQIAAEWLQIAQRSRWRAYRKLTIGLSNGAIADPLRHPLRAKWGFHRPPTYANGDISATGDPIHFMFGSIWWGFRGRRIEQRYLRFEQIQDGGRRHVGKISNGHISATGRPIHFMFCSSMGFSGTADLMELFPVRTNPRWRPSPSWKNFKWLYLRNRSDPLHVWPSRIISNGHSPQQLTIYLYSAHRAVIFAIAQLSCCLMLATVRQ